MGREKNDQCNFTNEADIYIKAYFLTFSMAQKITCRAFSKQSGPGPVLEQIFSSMEQRTALETPKGCSACKEKYLQQRK